MPCAATQSSNPVLSCLFMTQLVTTTCLLFFQMISSGQDEKPISIKSCIVDIAYDYRKRENVFKLATYNGSQYLFQVQQTLLFYSSCSPAFSAEKFVRQYVQ